MNIPHETNDEDGENEGGVCSDCFKRKITGAADVCNAKSRLQRGLEMQQNFIAKYADQPKKPKTFETRRKLENFYRETLEEFDAQFQEQLPEYADVEEFGEKERCVKKRKLQ